IRAVASGSSWPSMWPECLLDLKQIMNHPQVSIIISAQDEDFPSYMIDLKVQVWSLPWSLCKLIFSFQDNP
ncbi:hypothetical protein Celaphus_00000473, partial [Cervus elaphus hippelaphus]